MTITVSPDIELQLTSQKHAEGLFEVVNTNRAHLSRFLPWVNNMQSVNDFENYILHCELLYEQKTDISFVIIVHGITAGRIGLHYIHTHNRSGSIGYWLGKAFEGKGIMLQCCKAIIQYGFETVGLHRIEIKAAAANTRSQGLPEKLHFIKEGILRQAEWVNNEYHDLILYSLLANEWKG